MSCVVRLLCSALTFVLVLLCRYRRHDGRAREGHTQHTAEAEDVTEPLTAAPQLGMGRLQREHARPDPDVTDVRVLYGFRGTSGFLGEWSRDLLFTCVKAFLCHASLSSLHVASMSPHHLQRHIQAVQRHGNRTALTSHYHTAPPSPNLPSARCVAIAHRRHLTLSHCRSGEGAVQGEVALRRQQTVA